MNRKEKAQAARVAGKRSLPLISDETFRELYAALLKCRMLDERLASDAGYERWRGREAVTAGITACLRAADCVTSSPRGVLATLLQNGLTAAGRRASVASTIPLATATGDALRHKLEKKGGVTVVFAETSEPESLREILSVASCHLLPVLYVLDDGFQSSGASGGVPVIRVDSLDTIAVYRVAHEAIQRAREGGGPTIMECAAWPGESGTDSLQKLELYLEGKKLFHSEWKSRLENAYAKSLADFGNIPGLNTNTDEMDGVPVYTRGRNAVA